MTDETGTSAAVERAHAVECDLVMKGGITSGIVYPLAVVEIAKAFRLRSIGGTSAGAIAAAAAAAAELGRQRFNTTAGFKALEELPAHLVKTSEDGHGTKLMAFFKPAPALRPLFDVFLAVMGTPKGWGRAWAGIKALFPHFGLVMLLGVVIGGVPIGWAVARSGSAPVWPWALAGAITGGLLVLLYHALRLALRELPRNGFGACSGMPASGDTSGEALTVWLTDYLDTLCGQREAYSGVDAGKPLTFGDLREHGIDLQMMTTCLTLGRPFRLPFRDDPQVRENKQFYYRETEFAALFPERVMAWMHARERPAGAPGPHPPGYRRLTAPDDMPVVVAVRMSLSFPLLLSAIPLHAVDYNRRPVAKGGAKPVHQLERCWFTDGGVGSNFPIHFFDSALPCRPTFGLDLGRAEDGQAERVRFPRDNGDARLCWWRRFSGDGFAALTDFLGAVIHVAKDWNHETLSHLPGFRDRIGLIQLTRKEGGLNLSMDADLIRALTGYGREAGIAFVERFGGPSFLAGKPPHAMDWGNHQIIRLRLLLAGVAELLCSMEKTCSTLHGTSADYARFFVQATGPHAYRFDGLNNLDRDAQGNYYTQAGLAFALFERLRELARMIAASNAARPDTALDRDAPRPTPELKTRPRV